MGPVAGHLLWPFTMVPAELGCNRVAAIRRYSDSLWISIGSAGVCEPVAARCVRRCCALGNRRRPNEGGQNNE
jgi:hypothetical protein